MPALRKPMLLGIMENEALLHVCLRLTVALAAGKLVGHVTRRKFAKRWTRARSDSPGQDDAGLYHQRRRKRADRDRQHAGDLHGDRGRRRPFVPEGPGQRLGDRRVRHAAARDRAAHGARIDARKAVGTHAGNSAADRADLCARSWTRKSWAKERCGSIAT